jgi:hypothetical protein
VQLTVLDFQPKLQLPASLAYGTTLTAIPVVYVNLRQLATPAASARWSPQPFYP